MRKIISGFIVCLFFSIYSEAQLQKIEQRIEQTKKTTAKPLPTPSPTPEPTDPSWMSARESERSEASFWDGLSLLLGAFVGSGSPENKTVKAELYTHAQNGNNGIAGFDLGAAANLQRLFLKAEYERLSQESFVLSSTKMKFGYTIALGPTSIALFLGHYGLHGRYSNNGLNLGLQFNWHIEDALRTEFVIETTDFGGSSLKQASGSLQYVFIPRILGELGVRNSDLTGSDLEYTTYFAGVRLNWEE